MIKDGNKIKNDDVKPSEKEVWNLNLKKYFKWNKFQNSCIYGN